MKNKAKIVKVLKDGKVEAFNKWRKIYSIEDLDLRCADLSDADLRNADLKDADLFNANLSDADLRYANLRNANLSYADLRNASLRNANLRNANLSYADLRDADLFNANLSYADLRGADLRGVDLDFSTLPLWCGSLDVKFDQKHIVQFLYHAGMPCQNNKIELDKDLEKLLNSKMFKKVVNKFHRIGNDVGKFVGTYKEIK